MKHLFPAVAAVALIFTPVQAQQSQTPPPPPCQSEEYRAFDFWLGVWDVFQQDGTLAGTNTITKEEGGCLLLEKWVNVQGGTGQSYNFYDPGMGKYRQVWVSGGAVIDYAGGLNEAGEMILEGDINYHNGSSAPFRGTWTLQEDGSVRQFFEQFNATTEKWDPWFLGIYRKQAE